MFLLDILQCLLIIYFPQLSFITRCFALYVWSTIFIIVLHSAPMQSTLFQGLMFASWFYNSLYNICATNIILRSFWDFITKRKKSIVKRIEGVYEITTSNNTVICYVAKSVQSAESESEDSNEEISKEEKMQEENKACLEMKDLEICRTETLDLTTTTNKTSRFTSPKSVRKRKSNPYNVFKKRQRSVHGLRGDEYNIKSVGSKRGGDSLENGRKKQGQFSGSCEEKQGLSSVIGWNEQSNPVIIDDQEQGDPLNTNLSQSCWKAQDDSSKICKEREDENIEKSGKRDGPSKVCSSEGSAETYRNETIEFSNRCPKKQYLKKFYDSEKESSNIRLQNEPRSYSEFSAPYIESTQKTQDEHSKGKEFSHVSNEYGESLVSCSRTQAVSLISKQLTRLKDSNDSVNPNENPINTGTSYKPYKVLLYKDFLAESDPTPDTSPESAEFPRFVQRKNNMYSRWSDLQKDLQDKEMKDTSDSNYCEIIVDEHIDVLDKKAKDTSASNYCEAIMDVPGLDFDETSLEFQTMLLNESLNSRKSVITHGKDDVSESAIQPSASSTVTSSSSKDFDAVGGEPSTSVQEEEPPAYKTYPGLAEQPLKVKKDARFQKRFYRRESPVVLPRKVEEAIQELKSSEYHQDAYEEERFGRSGKVKQRKREKAVQKLIERTADDHLSECKGSLPESPPTSTESSSDEDEKQKESDEMVPLLAPLEVVKALINESEQNSSGLPGNKSPKPPCSKDQKEIYDFKPELIDISKSPSPEHKKRTFFGNEKTMSQKFSESVKKLSSEVSRRDDSLPSHLSLSTFSKTPKQHESPIVSLDSVESMNECRYSLGDKSGMEATCSRVKDEEKYLNKQSKSDTSDEFESRKKIKQEINTDSAYGVNNAVGEKSLMEIGGKISSPTELLDLKELGIVDCNPVSEESPMEEGREKLTRMKPLDITDFPEICKRCGYVAVEEYRYSPKKAVDSKELIFKESKELQMIDPSPMRSPDCYVLSTCKFCGYFPVKTKANSSDELQRQRPQMDVYRNELQIKNKETDDCEASRVSESPTRYREALEQEFMASENLLQRVRKHLDKQEMFDKGTKKELSFSFLKQKTVLIEAENVSPILTVTKPFSQKIVSSSCEGKVQQDGNSQNKHLPLSTITSQQEQNSDLKFSKAVSNDNSESGTFENENKETKQNEESYTTGISDEGPISEEINTCQYEAEMSSITKEKSSGIKEYPELDDKFDSS